MAAAVLTVPFLAALMDKTEYKQILKLFLRGEAQFSAAAVFFARVSKLCLWLIIFVLSGTGIVYVKKKRNIVV
jgi:hypothetical protein